MTRHWVEANIDGTGAGVDLICEHPTACMETDEGSRSLGCCVADFFDNSGTDMFQDHGRFTFGRVDVAVSWRGSGEDAEPLLAPINPSLSQQMGVAVRAQLGHAATSHAIDRKGWTREQWVADARRLFGELDGSVLDLVNGHVVYMLNEIDVLNHRLAELESKPSDSQAVAGSQPTATAGDTFDWREIAIRLFTAPLADHSLLSTKVRDALEAYTEGEENSDG